MSWEYNNYLAHHGVKGQKWGHRKWQNEDGSYTEAGKRHYGFGDGRQTSSGESNQQKSRTVSTSTQKQKSQPSAAEIEARKERTKKILGIAAGVAIAAAAGYGAYKGGKAIKNWSNEGKRYRHDLVRQMKDLDSKRFIAEIEKRWSYSDEKNYQKTMRSLTGTALKTYVTRKRKWTLPTYYGRTAHL